MTPDILTLDPFALRTWIRSLPDKDFARIFEAFKSEMDYRSMVLVKPIHPPTNPLEALNRPQRPS